MKKLLGIILIIVMTVCMTTVVCCAADDHGADARSTSMSVESGEDPIDDETVTEEAGGGEIIEGDEDIDENLSDVPDEEELQEADETADDAEEALEEDPGSDKETGSEMKAYIILGAAALVIILIIVLAVRSARKNKSYRSKH